MLLYKFDWCHNYLNAYVREIFINVFDNTSNYNLQSLFFDFHFNSKFSDKSLSKNIHFQFHIQ